MSRQRAAYWAEGRERGHGRAEGCAHVRSKRVQDCTGTNAPCHPLASSLRCPTLPRSPARLDKELTIGQMQGRFQLVLMPTAGHAIQVRVHTPAHVEGCTGLGLGAAQPLGGRRSQDETALLPPPTP